MSDEVVDAQTGVRPDREPNTLMNAIVGAVVMLITAPLLPFAAIVGGGIAGYLQRGPSRGGAKVGAFSGALAAVPSFIVVWFVIGVFMLGLTGAPFGPGFIYVIALFIVLLGYFVGAGALGGAVGAYLQKEL